jgi:hypothetical protein
LGLIQGEKTMRGGTPLEEAGTEVERSRTVALLSAALDLPLVVYGLTIGTLAVGASALVNQADRQLGAFTRMISLLVMTTIAVAAGRYGDLLLRWLLPLPRRSQRIRHS